MAPTATSASFITLLHQLPAPQQTVVHEWYERMGAPSMQGATAAQVAWMRARGYPMPDDIARAAAMSDAELKTAAGTGDATAQALYLGRLLERFNTLTAANMSRNDTRRTSLLIEITHAMLQELASGSPYAGYLYAARSRLMYPGQTESNATDQLAGLVWASKFGDTRADKMMRTPTLQAIDALAATSAISLMLVQAANVNPLLFSTPVTPIPSS